MATCSSSLPHTSHPTSSVPFLGNAEELEYTIHKCSSHSANYVPENILVDKPSDQASRWTSESNWPPQFITLKLDKISIVESITFGKYEKTHVCNLQKFQILGGLSEDKMVELLNSGLQNSHEAEEFPLTYVVEGYPVPCQYIKIVPILTYGTSYNFSIWYVKLKGIQEESAVQFCLCHYNQYREREVIRLCLKHFRQHNYPEAFEKLQQTTNVVLEDPLLTELHRKVVCEGDYRSCERILEGVMQEGLFASFISKQTYQAEWSLMSPSVDDDGRPGMRGGHQMCIDPEAEMIYLLGGWDGFRDLGDFWSYNINTNHWTCISGDTTEQDGPSPRSCFKLCIDTTRKQVYTLGRYMDSNMRKVTPLKSDFYVYDIEASKWTLICDDTAAYGGPRLIFDHQMCMDPVNSMIYVFGGRILTSGSSDTLTDDRPLEGSFSGLYSYHIPTNTWTLLRPDTDAATNGQKALKARIGHSMLFHPRNRKLYIFGGQRGRECLSDFFSYDLDSGDIEVILDGSKKDDVNAPSLGSTQRATIDPELNEIHVLSGMSKEKERKDTGIKNSFWVYYVDQKRWSCVYKNENSDHLYWKKQQQFEPCPRYAHQLVYDHINKKHYLFGGNPGKKAVSKPRLDDFWLLMLKRPSNEQLLRRCLYLLRKTKFLEMAASNPVQGLKYLQNDMKEVVDLSNPQEREEFQQLASNLFRPPGSDVPIHLINVQATESNPHFAVRTELFDTLVNFFPDHMTQPKSNLLDYLL